jgi:Outer membrane protein beta-barrel domain
MSHVKFTLSFLLVLLVIGSCNCQTLLGVESGVNWTSLRDPNEMEGGILSCKSFLSYYFSFEIKGRKSKHIHLGGDLSFFQSYFNLQTTSGGHFPEDENINYKISTLRISIFPELTFGKKVQFFFTLGPYFGCIITASKKGTSTNYNGYPYMNLQTENETGSATGDFHIFDFGLQETAGVGYLIKPWFMISVKETGALGLLPVDYGSTKSENISLLFGVSFIIPKQQVKETTKPFLSKNISQ